MDEEFSYYVEDAPVTSAFCPHCGEQIPYGEKRMVWISRHLENLPHKYWWRIKKKLRR